ncbi:hypothetical protein HY450_02720 [Candidatus Pacearchaeota archaeon]|nr:hypothetical protein [Candidatus Pacearchaeota archaeon]
MKVCLKSFGRTFILELFKLMMSGLNFVLVAIIVLLIFLSYFLYRLGVRRGVYRREIEWQENLSRLRREIAEKQRVGIKGKVAEAFAPYLPEFPFKPSECKFIGDPIDYLVFEGLDERDIRGIHLVEIKDGKSKLSKHQKQIKDLIDKLNSEEISFKEVRFNED